MLKNISPKIACKMLNDEKGVLIDVRSEMEIMFVGYPKNSVHIPWLTGLEMSLNINFLDELINYLSQKFKTQDLESIKNIPLLLICRSGGRSVSSGEYLINNGFNNVYNVLEGFEGNIDENCHRGNKDGWRFHNLPWMQN